MNLQSKSWGVLFLSALIMSQGTAAVKPMASKPFKPIIKISLIPLPPLYTPMQLAKKRFEPFKIKKFYDYSNDLSHSEWKATGDPKQCYLSYKIPSYGEVGFRRRAGYEDTFEILSWQGLRQESPAEFYALQASWQPSEHPDYLGEALLTPARPLLTLEPVLSRQLLKELEEGKNIAVQYPVPESPTQGVRLQVSSVRFQEPFKQYLECQSQLLPYDFKEMRQMTILFEATKSTFSDSWKSHLDKLIHYYHAGAKIQTIVIEGYTDNAGFYELNRRVSQARAESVKNYLIQGGIPESTFEIKAQGSSNPVASNQTKEGRSKNRRVVIMLKMKD